MPKYWQWQHCALGDACHLEDIFLSISDPITFGGSSRSNTGHLRIFFEECRNVKVLRLHHGLESIVARLLLQPTVNSLEVDRDETTFSGSSCTLIKSNKSQITMGILPSLEEIVLYPTHTSTFCMLIGAKERASSFKSFGHFATVRQQMGRPVKVFWSADSDGKVPRYFMTNSLK